MVTAVNVHYKFHREVVFHSVPRPPPLLPPANVNTSSVHRRGLFCKWLLKARSHLTASTVDAVALASGSSAKEQTQLAHVGKQEIHLKSTRKRFSAEWKKCAAREMVLIIYGLAKAGFDILSNTMLSSAFCTEEDRIRANMSLTCSSGTSNSAHLVKPFAGNPSETGKSLSYPHAQKVQY